MKFEGIWYNEIALYVAIHTARTELNVLQLDEVCPTRQTNCGSKPTVKTLMSDDTEKRFNNWNQPLREPDKNEKWKLLVTALAIGMKHIMKNHVYNHVNVIK